MRVIERGANEHGRDTMQKRYTEELKARGFKELAAYLSKLLR